MKADLIAMLLSRRDEWATVRDSRRHRLPPAAVRRAADDLATARLIESREGQPAGYRALSAAWAPLLAPVEPTPQWASWHERVLFVASFMHWADAANSRPLSGYAFGVHGRELLEQHRRAFCANDMVAVWSAHSPVNDWADFVERSVRALAGWIEEQA
ncbi:MAG: hypothetical protein IPP90_14565 [Gemmatimonadaceae bacterium]|nr:hypothetical protein [Gemmatimonadaceae bacterium]